MLYAFFWVIPRHPKFMCRRFETLCSIFISRPMKMEQSVPKRRHIHFRRRGITQKKAYNIQNTAKAWNHEDLPMFRVKLFHCLQGRQAVFYPEDGGNKFLWNVNRFLQHYTASYLRRPYATHLRTYVFPYLFLFVFVLRRPIGLSHRISRSDSKGKFD